MRFGLFGTGPWAHQAHAPGLAAHDGVEFVGVWGRNEAKAAELAGRYGVRAYPTVDGLIDDVEAIAAALPPDVQAPIALRAARSGRHLLLDKPVAFDPAITNQIAQAVAERDLGSVVFITRRFRPSMRSFLADTARTGGWVEARVDHISSIYTEGNPYAASAWRRASNGGLWDVGPHALALVLPVLGPVTEVAAMADGRGMSYLLLRHDSGAISRLALSVGALPAATRNEAVFAGEAGLASVPRETFDPIEAFVAAVDELLAAAAGTACPEVDIRFGAQVTTILAAAAESAESGRTVRIG